MAYFGSTQASSIANPPRQLVGPFANNPVVSGSTAFLSTQGSTAAYANAAGGLGGGLWMYNSTNLTTDLTASGNQPFFTDGYYIGMRPGDIVMGVQFTSAGSSAISYQLSITSVSTAGAATSTGACMTSTFN